MKNLNELNLEDLSIEQFETILKSESPIYFGSSATAAIEKACTYLQNKVETSQSPMYGINTGFGSLCNVIIEKQEIQELQKNLVLSHACGTGDLVPLSVVKIILLLKIRSLSFGHSGVRPEILERLIFHYNHNILPVIFQQGSLGASGDLAPLAHLSLPILGEGQVWINSTIAETSEFLDKFQQKPLHLAAKEGLALLNGTQFSTGYGVYALIEAKKLIKWANCIGAMSADAFMCSNNPFDVKLHAIRKQAGQIETAKSLRKWLENSEICASPKSSVQDPYAFRCMPQVHGASWDTIQYATSIIQNEMNAVTDNPNIFPDEDEILSGGNFHAQPIALVLDFLAIALSELGSISERRTYQLIAGLRGLPPFLAKNAGLHSGFMIPQYTAASIVSQNKQYCTPASVDSIVSSNGQEDHVSMAANAATKLYKVVENIWTVLAIEWMNACQAIEFRKPLKTSPQLTKLHEMYREEVTFADKDRQFSKDIAASIKFLKKHAHLV